MSDLNSIYKDTEDKMNKHLDNLCKELSKVRTDRAHPNLLEQIQVDCYGQKTSLIKIASIIVEDARTLAINPYDKGIIASIDKAIVAANLGLNPVTSGGSIRVPIPALNEERRKELVKKIKADVEHAKISVRNVRRDANIQIKSLAKAKVISINDEKTAENKIQKLTDQHIDKIDDISAKKETDVMKV